MYEKSGPRLEEIRNNGCREKLERTKREAWRVYKMKGKNSGILESLQWVYRSWRIKINVKSNKGLWVIWLEINSLNMLKYSVRFLVNPFWILNFCYGGKSEPVFLNPRSNFSLWLRLNIHLGSFKVHSGFLSFVQLKFTLVFWKSVLDFLFLLR